MQEDQNTTKHHTTEIDKIISQLKYKLENQSSKSEDYLEIITTQRNKLVESENNNIILKHNISDLERKLQEENERKKHMINDLSEENKILRSMTGSLNNIIGDVNLKNLVDEVERLKEERRVFEADMCNARNVFDEELKNERRILEERFSNEKNMHELKAIEKTRICKDKLKDAVDNQVKKILEIESEKLQSLYKVQAELENDIKTLKEELYFKDNLISELRDNFKNKRMLFEENEKIIIEGNQLIRDLRLSLEEKEILIKSLKGEVIDLKGGIRVFCRLRPPEDDYKNDRYGIMVESGAVILESNRFLFDRVFEPLDGQVEVYDEIAFLIENIFEGYNSCIFAYGQTGSGKTYTMDGTDQNRGIIPRALENIFRLRDLFIANKWDVKLILSYVEIYNENINDLLNYDEKLKCEIQHEEGVTTLRNCKYVEVVCIEEAYDLLKLATQNRSVGATKCNDRSSRSHSIFTLNIVLTRNDEVRRGTLNLVDLAGSERLTESLAEGIRLKETQNINKSLSALGNVITAILKGDSFIPYRNSKLTFLLKNCLSGQARVLMFVNISPEMRHFNETLCSLRFAGNVSECKLGKTMKNVIKRI